MPGAFDVGPYEAGVAPDPSTDTIHVGLGTTPKTAITRMIAYLPPQAQGKQGTSALAPAFAKTAPLVGSLFEGFSCSLTGNTGKHFGMVTQHASHGVFNYQATSSLRSLYLEPVGLPNYHGAMKTVFDLYTAAGAGGEKILVLYGCDPAWNGGVGAGRLPKPSLEDEFVLGVKDALEQGVANNCIWTGILLWNEFKVETGDAIDNGLAVGWETDPTLDPNTAFETGILTDANYLLKIPIAYCRLLNKLAQMIRAHPDPKINGISIGAPYLAAGGVQPVDTTTENHHQFPLGDGGSIPAWAWDRDKLAYILKWADTIDRIYLDYSIQDFNDWRAGTSSSYVVAHHGNLGTFIDQAIALRNTIPMVSRADAKNSASTNLARKRNALVSFAECYASSDTGTAHGAAVKWTEQQQAMHLGLLLRECWTHLVELYHYWAPEAQNDSATGPMQNQASLLRPEYFGDAGTNNGPGGLATNGAMGEPYLSYFVARLFTDHFGPGTNLYPVTGSNPVMRYGPASETECLVINTSASAQTETLGGITYSIPAYAVVVLPGVPAPTTLPIFNGPAVASVPAGAAVAVSTPATGLAPLTTYHARIRATRQDGQGGTQLSPDITFTTPTASTTIPPDQDPDNAAFNPGSYNTWFAKFGGKGAFGVDPSCYPASTRTIVGNTTTQADLQASPTPRSGRRVFMSNGSTVPDAVCPFKDTGDIPPTTAGPTKVMPDGSMYTVTATGRCIRTNAEGTDSRDVTGCVVIHGAAVVNGSLAALSADPTVPGDVSGNFPFAPYNCQLIQVSQFLQDDLVTFNAPAPVNAGGTSPTTPSRAARCALTINQKSFLFDLTNCHLFARNIHTYYVGSGDIADATWILKPSSIQAGSTKYAASGSVDLRFYFRDAVGTQTTVTGSYVMGAGTMNVGATATFPASGYVQLGKDQVVVAYTGKTSTTLTGCTTVVGSGTIAGGTNVNTLTRQTATVAAPITTQKLADAVSALSLSGTLSNMGVVGLNNSGPWALQFQGDSLTNTLVKSLTVCAHVEVGTNTLKDQVAANVTFPALSPVRSPYGTGGHPLGCGGSTGQLERFYHEMRWGDGNKTGKGAREFTLAYGSDVLNPERFSNVAQAGHVDGVQELGVDKTAWGGNRTGWSNERSGKLSKHAVLLFNAGNTGVFHDGQYLSGIIDLQDDRLLVHGVNKGISFNGSERCGAQRSYFVQGGDTWYPNRFSGSLADPILPQFDHIITVPKSMFIASVQNYATDPWQVGFPSVAGNPSLVTSTTFVLQILTAYNQLLTTGPIAWSSTQATLQANVAAALNALVPAASNPDSNIGAIAYAAPSSNELANGWQVNITFNTAIRMMSLLSQDGDGIDVGCPHAPPTSNTWPSALADGSAHPLQNVSVSSTGAYTPINRSTGGNGVSDGCAPPLAPQKGSTVYDPTTYQIPADAIVCLTNADVATALTSSTPVSVLIPAGTTIFRASPLTLTAAHRIYGADPATSIITCGIDARDTVGAEIHGVTLQPATSAACPVDGVTGLPALIPHRSGSGLVVSDVYLKGVVASHPVSFGLIDRAPGGASVERVVAIDFALEGVSFTDASITSTRVAKRLWDVNASAITDPTTRGRTGEAGVRLSVPCTDGLKRIKVRDSGMIGVRLDGSVHSLYWSDIDVDDVFGIIPSGPDAGKEWGIGMYFGRYVGAQAGIAGAGACYGSRYRLGPNLRYGVYTEPFVTGQNPAPWKLRFTRGWINASRSTLMGGASSGISTFGFFLDDGAQDTHIQTTRFAGTFSGGSAIRDRGGAWTWGQTPAAYTRPVSAGTSTTKLGTDNTNGTVSYG